MVRCSRSTRREEDVGRSLIDIHSGKIYMPYRSERARALIEESSSAVGLHGRHRGREESRSKSRV